ncbi:hypothetical protein Hanom_Chr05g00463691 [Helianthus anomalus]
MSRKFTCFEMNCLTSVSVMVDPFDFTTNATGTSPAFSSTILKYKRKMSTLKDINLKG